MNYTHFDNEIYTEDRSIKWFKVVFYGIAIMIGLALGHYLALSYLDSLI